MSLSHKLEDLSLVFHARLGIVAHIWNSNTPKVRRKVETELPGRSQASYPDDAVNKKTCVKQGRKQGLTTEVDS